MMLREWAARMRGMFRKPELDEEIATHISLVAAEYERRGMTPEQAQREARRQFGGVTQIRETYRDQQGFPWIEGILQDIGYALRQLRKSPLFAAAAVVTLALGIGANTAVFRALDVILLRSLPVRNARQLVVLGPRNMGVPGNFTFKVYRELASHREVIQDAFAAGDVWQSQVSLAGAPIQTGSARLVTGGYFSILGVDAAIGRVLTEADDRADAPPAVVISYKLWQRAFSGSPSAIGKVLKINSATATIVGVAPRNFQGERVLFRSDLWLPMSLQPRIMDADWLRQEMSFLDAMARLKPGVSAQQAQAALEPVYQRLLAHDGQKDRLEVIAGNHGITLEQIEESVGNPLRVLMSMVAALLMIACCNLANLLLARGAARTHEIGIRLAMGAGRARLVRQLLTESLLLATLGTAAGFLLAEWGTRILMAQIDQEFDFGADLGWRVLGFVMLVSVAATCVFGVAPALAGTRLDIRSALQGNSRVQSTGRPRQRLGRLFVMAQVSICLMLLSGAALLARSLWNLERQDWGFRTQGLLMAEVPVDMAHDSAKDRNQRLKATQGPIFEKVNALPGVRSAALVGGGPLGSDSWSGDVAIPGRNARPTDNARVVHVSPRYFETMGIPILRGRALQESDRAKTARVAVLSQTAARRIFDGKDPIGQYFSLGSPFDSKNAVEVVGVAHDIRMSSPREEPGVIVFAPLEQQQETDWMPFNTVVLRTEGDPAALASEVRQVLTENAGGRTLGEIRPVTDILSGQLDNEETLAELAAGFGVLALVMAAVGLYGVISYAVARRTQEMGIRLALGASRQQLTALVMGDVGKLLAAGIVVGSMASVACGRVMRSLLFGITVRDGSWLVLAGLLLAMAAALAGYLPARRAGRLSPMEALRQQ